MTHSRMWTAIFWFEVRYQLRQPLFYLITGVLSVLLFIAGTDNGASGSLHLNAPPVILEQLLKGIYLVLFLLTAFATSAAVRDFDRQTSELFFSKPITWFDYLTARFAGTMAVCTLPYMVGTIALAVSTAMPGLDGTRLGPFRFAPYVFGVGVLVMPTLLALGAAIFALACWSRSSLITYMGVVAFFALSAAAGIASSQLQSPWISQLLDPFGVTALSGALKYWTMAEMNAMTPAVAGMILWNRLLWLGLGSIAFTAAVATFEPTRRHGRWRTARARDAVAETADEQRAIISTKPTAPPAPAREFTLRTTMRQLAHQVRRETAMVLIGLPFLGMLALGLFVLLQAASSAGNLFGMPVYPRTYLMLEALQGIYSIVLLLVVVLYSGELIWRERSLALNEVVDSMPTPNGVHLGAKLTALLLVIVVYLVVGVVALIGFQWSRGYREVDLALYAQGAALAAVYPALMLVLAGFCHVVARNRLMGYACVIVFIVAWDLLEELGFEHHLYRFASLPETPYSEMSGYGPFLAPFGWYGLYWGLVALVLVGLSALFWRNGTDDGWRTRWADARGRFRGAVRATIGVGGSGALVVGSWIFYNTNVVNAYVPSTVALDDKARYEREYQQYREVALPRIVAVRVNVDVYPDQQQLEIRGSFRLRNRSVNALRDIHLSIPDRVRVKHITLPPHDVVLADTVLGYRILRLREPLAPGADVELGFDVAIESHGFVNNGTPTTIISNGTYFTNRDVLPVIGYDARRQIENSDERRKRDLESASHFASIDDSVALRRTPRSPDADRVEFESTISTSLDQVAVTSGELQREWVEHARRYFHYRAAQPITYYVAFASAKYQVTRRTWNGVSIEVYHHPGHDENIGRMIDAAEASLAYNTANFGAYQHPTLRLVEYPRYDRDATSFPGLIAFSESMGFNADVRGAVAVDYPFYVTAHEVAHQWWGQQVVGANVQGVGMLHETLAQYSALMVMRREFGEPGVRRVLAYEHDWYLRGRAGERGREAALALAERQEYVYYHKGALAMNALRDAAGEAALNQALERYRSRFASGEPPYSTTRDVIQEVRRALPDESGYLIGDMFERLTLFRSSVDAATVTRRADGQYLVRVELALHKFRVDSAGVEREIPIDDWVDIAVFGEGDRGTTGAVVGLERRRIRASDASVEVVVSARPESVEVDPYYKLIDRDRSDNVRAVSSRTR